MIQIYGFHLITNDVLIILLSEKIISKLDSDATFSQSINGFEASVPTRFSRVRDSTSEFSQIAVYDFEKHTEQQLLFDAIFEGIC